MGEIEAVIDYGFNRAGNRQLRRQWRPDGPAKAVVLVIHGISEHSGRYQRLGSTLAGAGYGVVAFDQRGHGETQGSRGHVERFDEFCDDVEDQLTECRRLGVPVVLLGHSMGGLVATTYAISQRPQPDLLVLSGPALGTSVPNWQRFVVDKACQLAPRFYASPPFDPAVLACDPAVGRAYMADPLIKPGGSLQLLSQLMATADETAAAVDRLAVPTLCLHGGDDELVAPSVSEVLDPLPGVDRRVLPGLRHEIFNEAQGPVILGDVITWMDSQLA